MLDGELGDEGVGDEGAWLVRGRGVNVAAGVDGVSGKLGEC